jgi:exportin-T
VSPVVQIFSLPMDELKTAIELAMITVDPALKEQAMQYCNSIKALPNGWEICLQTAETNQYFLLTSAPEIRFFCFQVLEETLRHRYQSLDQNQRLLLRKTFWKWTAEHLQEKFPYFLKMKLFVLIIVLFKNEYPAAWPTFFDELYEILQGGRTRCIKSFLQICTTIDEEVVCQYIQRSPEELAKNTVIKDTMRDHAIPRLLETWHSIFITYRSNASIAKRCLVLFGLYVSWIDIGLVLKDGFHTTLYECFGNDELKNAACECLGNIVLKGMKPSDKLDLIHGLDVIPFLSNLRIVGDEEFEEQIAKLINNIGMELCDSYENPASTDEEKFRIIAMLDNLFPLLLKYLANEYDDTTSALFPFLSGYLLLLKRVRRMSTQGISNDNLRSLLEVLAIKMKYDEDEEYGMGDGEDESLFMDVRRSLKVHLESISTIDESLFTNCVCDVVCRTFDSWKAGNQSGLKWSDAELAIYLLYGFVEAKVSHGPPVFILENGSVSPLGIMLSKLMESGISEYPHPAVSTIYFEVLIRYAKFFEQRQDLIPIALQSFLDSRGLFHSIKSLRLRVNYLFLRFVKALRPVLARYTESILSVIQVFCVDVAFTCHKA